MAASALASPVTDSFQPAPESKSDPLSSTTTSTYFPAESTLTPPTANAHSPTEAKPAPLAANKTLDSLQSREQLQLLNEIDKLRAYGVNDFVSLPQIVVCGDQSSGKSSVLEAITEIPFPRKDNLCTRFATQIVLRRATKTKVLVKILPDSKRSENERKRLADFTGSLENFGDLPLLIERAQEAMGIAAGSGAFSRDVLSIEISGPGRPQLTVVDLPGLTHTENKSQSRRDVELVSDLVQKYMTDPRTIVLAIVTAKNDYANQIVLKRAKEVDPDGVRTLGIITKPDTLPEGSDSEDDFFSLAKNEDIFFKLGWHVLRNRSYEERDTTFENRNRLEAAFFERGVWGNLPRDCVGISSLRTRLSTLLLNRIKKELPRVYKEISDGLKDCESQLLKLGERRTTVDEQRVFLSKISEAFGRLCKSAADGIYEEKFFGDAMEEEGSVKRLRSVIQNYNIGFAEDVRQRGHSKNIIEDTSDAKNGRPIIISKPDDNFPQPITRKDAIEWVKPLLLRSRGRELPGTYNPLLIGEVFWEQSRPWESIAYSHLESIFLTCQQFLRLLLREIVPGDVLDSLFAYWIDGKMQERFEKANGELRSLLTDRRRHAITYNHYCTDNMQRARAQRLEERYMAAVHSVANWDPKVKGPISLDPGELLKALATPSQENMDDYACEEVLDGMSAFYKVASKVFIDNVAVQVVERQVVGGLWEILSPSAVVSMSVDMVSNIAEESMEDQQLRERLEAKMKSLQMGMEVCRGALKGVRVDSVNQTSPKKPRKTSFISSTPAPTSFEELSSLLSHAKFEDVGKRNTPVKQSVTPVPQENTTPAGGAFGGNRPAAPFGTNGGFSAFGAANTKPFSAGFGAQSAADGVIELFKASNWGGSAAGANTDFAFGTKPARTGNPSVSPTKFVPSLVTSGDSYGEKAYGQSVMFWPEYQRYSFEELRLREYGEGKRWSEAPLDRALGWGAPPFK